LPEPKGDLANRKCVVIDLDETLVHSSFKVHPYTYLLSLSLLTVYMCVVSVSVCVCVCGKKKQTIKIMV